MKSLAETCEHSAENDAFLELREAEPNQIDSELLRLLIDEIRIEESSEVSSYNRYHNRHNRSR